ncbi:CWF19-like protein (macronuclear) [Tetrahymena thermophila SB210]|uniref:CWF19-like protein n=1 Tax=Tetrahymena thermophila (strain SB210) TaxID=312017 RepID=Q22V25_TETTS|nr:CWF19-like protein [Tetrahymena thermophila SB210]EAR89123.2 CWF19-like protein [Tetrahymena thermophila SB210]|eukprot:XP_001009368.2 CWF19-like protein [Tetrahymena thermophila SB210]
MKKILVVGDLQGNFEGLAQKIQNFSKKGQEFNFAVCVGQTLSLEISLQDYKKSGVEMPIPVYFIDCSEMCQCLNHLYPTGTEIAKNIFFLGRSGIQEIQGLKVAFLNGLQSNKYSEFYTELHSQKSSFTGPYYSLQDIKLLEEEVKLSNQFMGVDIFLSNEWPEGFEKYTTFNEVVKRKSIHITKIAQKLSPRYHFCALEDKYYARFPYQNEQGHLSRLVCLGKWKSQQKHISAFQITPISKTPLEELKQITDDCTQNPYTHLTKPPVQQKVKDTSLSIQQQIENELMKEEEERLDKLEKSQGETEDLIKPYQPNGKQEKHSINLEQNQTIHFSGFDYRTNDDDIIEFLSRWGTISKINLVYDDHSKKHKGYGFVEYKDLQVTQKALNDSEKYSLHSRKIKFNLANNNKSSQSKQNDKCWFCYSNPNIDKSLIFYEGKHCYLALDKGPLSKNHFMIVPYDHLSSTLEFSQELLDEISKIKKNLLYIFENGYNQGLVIYQRYVKLSPNVSHILINCVPLDQNQVTQFQSNFESIVKHQKIDFFKLEANEQISSCVGEKEYYFNIDIYLSQDTFKRYLYVFKENERFPLDFGRQIICEILKMPHRLNWKTCQLTNDEQNECISEMKFNCQKFK